MKFAKLIFINLFLFLTINCFQSGTRRFQPGDSTTTSTPVKPTPTKKAETEVVKPKPVKKVPIKKYKQTIYINNLVDPKKDPDLSIEWLNDEYITKSRAAIPKDLHKSIDVPEGISYFRIANDTNILTSIPLRAVSNTIYKVTCSSLNSEKKCSKLDISGSKMDVVQRNLKDEEFFKNKVIPEGSKIIYVNNYTNKELQISWLSDNNKVVKSDDLSYKLGTQKLIIPGNAIKFKLIRAGSMTSNTIQFNIEQEFDVNCEPDEYDCNDIVITKTKKATKAINS